MLGNLFKSREPAATLKRSFEELQAKTMAHMDAWGLGNTERWDADLEEGLIWFSNPGLIVTARVQEIGAYNSEDGTWLWGWHHPSVKEELSRDAHLARGFGERYGLTDYVTRKVACTEKQAWQFTAVACHLAEAAGAYRGPASATTFVL